MDQAEKLACAEERISALVEEIAAARESSADLEQQIRAARAASQTLEAEISSARRAAIEFEAQIESARQGGIDLEAQLDRCRELDLDQRRRLSLWITRCVDLERALRAEWFRGHRAEGIAQDEVLARLSRHLNVRTAAALAESWPLTDAIPSGELIHRTSGHRDREHFALSRGPGLRTLLTLAQEAGCEPEKIERVLDFGCGCGRLLAAWEPYCPPVEVCGVDLDGDLIDWCNAHLPFVDAHQNQLEPPLDYPAGHFDLIYAASVFTHLTADAAKAWADELRRLLRAGGTLVASYHGPHYHEILRDSSEAEYDQLNETGFHVAQRGQDLTSSRSEGSNAFAAFHSQESFRALFDDWELRTTSLGADRGATHFASHQDVMVFRRL